MNAKEQVIECLKMLKSITASTQIEKINNLIAATEAAIFDVPSDEEMVKECMKFTDIRMYTEEEVLNLLLDFNNDKPGIFDASEWFEQFKKK